MIWISHPYGNANVRAVLRAFDRDRLLGAYFTTLAFRSDDVLLRYLPSGIRGELLRRSYPIELDKIHQIRMKEIARQIAIRCGWGKLSSNEKSWVGVDRVWQDVDRNVASYLKGVGRTLPQAVYAYEDGALESFKVAKDRGVRCIYDQPIGYYESAQKIFEEDRDRLPEFSKLLDGINDSEKKLSRKKAEAELADAIVSCSPFVTKTLLDGGIASEKIHEVQFGIPHDVVPKIWAPKDAEGALKVLFVGRISQRKGIGYLIKAVESLSTKNLELHLVGRISEDNGVLSKYRNYFQCHSSIPQNQVFEMMRRCHVLVLPSLFEGQALVVLEAMSIGLPVIITPNTGASGIARDGVDGFSIPVGSSEAIRDKLEWMLENRGKVSEMGESARLRVSTLRWDRYEDRIREIFKAVLSENK